MEMKIKKDFTLDLIAEVTLIERKGEGQIC